MKRLLLVSLLITSFGWTNAQTADTLYFSADKSPVEKSKASYYQVKSRRDSLYRIETYSVANKLQSVFHYSDTDLKTRQGTAIMYYPDGKIDARGTYKNNMRNGNWRFYDRNGKLTGFMYFVDNKIATADYLERYGHMMDDLNDAMPSFKGGKEALMDYIRHTFNPMQKDAKTKIKGTVKVGFVVSETGKITNAHIISGINEKVDQQALQLINNMPDWHPAMQSDRPIQVPLVLPIVF